MKAERVYVTIHESVLASWAKDFGTFGAIALMAWLNHLYCDSSVVLDVVAVLVALGHTLTINRRVDVSRDKLRAWVEEELGR